MAHLLQRLRQPRSRAEELQALRQRIAGAGQRASADEQRLAARLRALREELAAVFGEVRSCAHCAVGLPGPSGRFAGGHCCSGATDDVFSDSEVAALATAGTRARHLRAPTTDHAGCAFRGERGCTLAATHRPNVCVRYVCRSLSRELYARDTLDRVEALSAQLEQLFARFAELRTQRLGDEEWTAILGTEPSPPRSR